MAHIWSYENRNDGVAKGAMRTHWRDQSIMGGFLVEVALR